MKKTITSQLHTVQANTYLLLIKNHNYHWNVKGMHFQSLHLLFEVFYNEYFLGVDAVAEHLRAMDKKALGSTKEFKEYASVKEVSSGMNAKQMLKDLMKSEKQQIKDLELLIDMAEKDSDAATADLATERLQVHKKHYWMIKTHLD